MEPATKQGVSELELKTCVANLGWSVTGGGDVAYVVDEIGFERAGFERDFELA